MYISCFIQNKLIQYSVILYIFHLHRTSIYKPLLNSSLFLTFKIILNHKNKLCIACLDDRYETIHSFDGIDILVNNAGISSMKPYDQFALEEFDQLIDVNLKAVFVAIQATAPQMKSGGRIINIGSISAEFNPFPGNSLYVSTKAAVAGLTRALARDLAPQGVTINNIQPGMIDTDMNPENGAYAAGAEIIPLGRYGKASEIANMVAYISSEEASYITGASLNVDGGASI